MEYTSLVVGEGFDFDCCRIRQLVSHLPDDFFSDQLSSDEALTPVRNLILREEMRPHRRVSLDEFGQLLKAASTERRDRQHCLKATAGRQGFNKRQQFVSVAQQVGFVDNQRNRRLMPGHDV